MEKVDIKKFREQCLKFRAKSPESLNILAQKISTENDIVNPNSLSMALTGHRQDKRSAEILERLLEYLKQSGASTPERIEL